MEIVAIKFRNKEGKKLIKILTDSERFPISFIKDQKWLVDDESGRRYKSGIIIPEEVFEKIRTVEVKEAKQKLSKDELKFIDLLKKNEAKQVLKEILKELLDEEKQEE